MTEIKPRTYFFKPSHPANGEPVLNPVIVGNNSSRGVETTLVLDTNVLIAMEKVVKGGNKKSSLKQHGLHNLVDLLNRCSPCSICLSPGRAFAEMPPALAEDSRWKYEAFCTEHLPSFIDAPNCIRAKFEGRDKSYGYLDLEPNAQAFLAVLFCALLYLNVIDKKLTGSPIQNTKEIDITKYCFAEPRVASVETIRIRKLLRRNFLKTKDDKAANTFQEAMSVAFNRACDLTLINSVNVIDTKELDGTVQDCWIATRDKKLFEFSRISHYVNFDGEAGGLGDGNELLSEFLGQTFEGPLLGLQDLVVVVSQALLDVCISLDHDTPEPGSKLLANAMVAISPPRRAARRR